MQGQCVKPWSCDGQLQAYTDLHSRPLQVLLSTTTDHRRSWKFFLVFKICLVLMMDVNQNKVHIMYLPLLEDLAQAGNYSWALQYWCAYTVSFVERQSYPQRPWVVATFYCSRRPYTGCNFWH
ncbi:hypothetical protein J1N35_005863 [Gossypium stocksii]|uniref:Aminotransferase-like plant mobile domain-containing protein n=1 Tax=Gossypium stocksii TaxID=47602 RepID=A0A9D4AJD6_9ROSI|nr:hypothetical protein J1N35_005863 [Gossypium stocksii]